MKVVRRKSHLRNGRVVRAHPVRITQASIATGSMGMGTDYGPRDMMDELRRSEQRLLRDEDIAIRTSRLGKEKFERDLAAADAVARRAEFDRRVKKRLAPAWSEE